MRGAGGFVLSRIPPAFGFTLRTEGSIMKRILFLLALISASTAAAGAAVDIRAEMAAFDRAFIPVWALTVEGRLDLAAKAIPLLQREWYGFKERHYGDKTLDAGWRNDFDRIDALIREADAIIDGGRFPDLVRAPLERTAALLAGLRQRNGIDYYPDHLIAFRVVMDGIVAAGRDKELKAESVERIRALYPAAREAWGRLPAAGPGPVFHLTAAKSDALPGMIEAETSALVALGRALDANDAAAIAAAALAIRPPFLSVYYAFGDFHALMWAQPDAK
jgi:hypothetical protein